MKTPKQNCSVRQAETGSFRYAFYLEPDGTVLAVDFSLYRETPHGRVFEGYGAVYARHNSPVAWTCFSAAYLDLCIRVSRGEAARRHPALLERIEQEGA